MNCPLNKKFILFFIAGLPLAAANAQTQFGIKGGVNFATLTNSTGGKTYIAFHGGLLAKIPATDAFSIQPELVYSIQGIKGDGGSLPLSYINIPVMATYTLPAGVFFQTGPQFGILLSATVKADGQPDQDIKSSLKSTDFSWGFGAGYLTSVNVGFNFRYNLGLSNLGAEGGTSKNAVIQFGIFYLFGESGAKK